MDPAVATIEPETIFQGVTWKWQRTFEDYPATDGWTLTYVLNGPQNITFAATASGSDYLVNETPATTAAYAPGLYTWTAFLSKTGGDRFAVDDGTLRVVQDPATITAPSDLRSFNKRMLDAIEALLERRATKVEESYRIHNRELKNMDPLELEKWRGIYASRVRQEETGSKGRTLRFRFTS